MINEAVSNLDLPRELCRPDVPFAPEYKSSSNESGDGGRVEILIYPVGATASPVQRKGTEKR
jgi:hypothetical protein